MSVSLKIKEVLEQKHLKQSSVGVAAGYTAKQFNDMIQGRKKIYAYDIVPICRALDITPNELFSSDEQAS